MEGTLLGAGVACVIGAIVGGGLKAFGIELPVLKSVARQAMLAALGACLVLAGLLSPSPSLDKQPTPAETVSQKPETSPVTAKFGYIYLGMREDNAWVNNKYAYGPVIDFDGVPTNGDVVAIVQPVHLRSGLPPVENHLIMRDDLGILDLGAKVRIKTITRLDPEGFYWASVDIL